MRYFSLLSMYLLMLYSTLVAAQVKITEIDEHYTQLDFGYQIMMVHFNIRPADEQFRPLTGGFELTKQKRENYVNMVKEEILKLPSAFVTRYVIDNVFILAIKTENILGYHSDDLIVVEGRESEYLIRRTLFHEIAHEVATKSQYQTAYKATCDYFNANRVSGNALSYLKVPDLYELGLSTVYSQESAEEEFCELFADLMLPHHEAPLITYVTDHPQSILAEKVRYMIAFFSKNNASELDCNFFIGLATKISAESLANTMLAKGK